MRDSVQFLNTSEDLESFWEALRELGIAADTPVAIAS
jgi:hypothetical protein